MFWKANVVIAFILDIDYSSAFNTLKMMVLAHIRVKAFCRSPALYLADNAKISK